jgi:DNA end-binding protein Ku
MPRSIWNGAISFGLVNIPVKAYSATSAKDISFNTLHSECHSRLKNLRWCPVHERAVESDEVVRGYQVTKDQYLVVTDEDLESLPIPSKHTIDIQSMVSSTEVDPVYFEKAYVLEPETSGTKGYALLAAALEKQGMMGLAKVTMRTKERLCTIRVMDDTLMLETLYSADEVHVTKPAGLTKVKVTDREMSMAVDLIEELREPFEPEKYPDEYREAVVAMLESKNKGKTKVDAPPAPTNVIDLMDVLRASVAAAKSGKGPNSAAAKKPAAAKKAAAKELEAKETEAPKTRRKKAS